MSKSQQFDKPIFSDHPRHWQGTFAIGFLLSFPFVYLYCFALIEAKYSVFLQLQPFRTGRPLTVVEEFLFIFIFSLELLALLLGFSLLFTWIYKKIRPGRGKYATWIIPISVVLTYSILVTAQFQVLRYFKDGLNLLLVRQLGGGDIWAALHFVVNELSQLLPLIGAGLLLIAVLVLLWVRVGASIASYFHRARWISGWLKPRRLLVSNTVLFFCAFIIGFNLPVLNKSLGYSLAHHVYLFPWKYITDFDLDGFGLIPRPIDHAPFDPTRHPYAAEIIGNGIDENGVGGDLPRNLWHKSQTAWNPEQLVPRNVLLIVLESARADLYEAKYKNEWVMPNLHNLPGQPLTVIAHTAFTAPAITSIFNNVISDHESGTSLIDRFNGLGYRSAIFSAQNEGFGEQDRRTGMHRAHRFYDARSESSDLRMYLSSSKIAAAIPAANVLAQFKEWLLPADSRPFFAYINIQELHFPYAPETVAKRLIDKPIPRYSISEKEKAWLLATYYNTARAVDSSLADLVEFLKEQNQFDNTVILVVGDHGEELFDSGSLGHGTNISYEQNSPVGVLINSPWYPDRSAPIGLSEIATVIHNALTERDEYALPLRGSVLSLLGTRNPIQIGLFTQNGLSRYDFRKDSWIRQSSYGAGEEPTSPEVGLIHLWESYVLSLDSPAR